MMFIVAAKDAVGNLPSPARTTRLELDVEGGGTRSRSPPDGLDGRSSRRRPSEPPLRAVGTCLWSHYVKPACLVWLAVPLFALFARDAFARKWTDATGQFSVEADLLEVKDGTVVLRKTNGQTIAVPIVKLSDEDQRYVTARQSSDDTHTVRRSAQPPTFRSSTSNGRSAEGDLESDSSSSVFLGIAIVLAVMLVILKVIRSLPTRKHRKKAAMIREANAFLAGIRARKALTPIAANILLKKGEDAYLEAACTLNETRSVRHYQGAAMRVRIAKGVYVGGGGGTSVSLPEMTRIDSGRLLLTNRRLLFDGSTDDRSIPLDKIVSVKSFLDAIEVSTESRQKSMYFTVPNPLIWSAMIQILRAVTDPKDLSHLNIHVELE